MHLKWRCHTKHFTEKGTTNFYVIGCRHQQMSTTTDIYANIKAKYERLPRKMEFTASNIFRHRFHDYSCSSGMCARYCPVQPFLHFCGPFFSFSLEYRSNDRECEQMIGSPKNPAVIPWGGFGTYTLFLKVNLVWPMKNYRRINMWLSNELIVHSLSYYFFWDPSMLPRKQFPFWIIIFGVCEKMDMTRYSEAFLNPPYTFSWMSAGRTREWCYNAFY